jgi:hypothetical protein
LDFKNSEHETMQNRNPSLVVDSFRGSRNYLRAADMLAAAPLARDLASFYFFARAVAHQPGYWRPGAAVDAAATLTIRRVSGAEEWAFTTDSELSVTNLLPDIDETRVLINPKLRNDRLTAELDDIHSLWDHLVAAARYGGTTYFPGVRWYLAYLRGTDRCVQPVAGRELALTIGRRRGQFIELNFSIDGAPAGVLGLIQRDD